jgi:transcription antitermination factor NusG
VFCGEHDIAVDGPVAATEGGEALEARETVMGASEWYAVWTRSHCERQVAEQLSAKAFSPFLPETTVWSRRGGAAHQVQVPIFPGYLFVRHAMDKESYIEILKARGVVRILDGGWNRLTPIPREEVEAIQRAVEAGLPLYPHSCFRQGDPVRVVEGPLTGVEGSFVRDKPHRGRLILSINLLQTSVAVEVDAAFVEPTSPRHGRALSGAAAAV